MPLLPRPLARAIGASAVLAAAACGDSSLTAPAARGAALVPNENGPSASLTATGTPARAVTPLGAAVQLPRVTVPTAYVAPTGRRIVLTATGNLQTAIDTSLAGDIILLQPGAKYVGNFFLRGKAGSAPVVIETNGANVPLNVRVTPTAAATFAKILTPNAMPALVTKSASSNFRIQQVEISAEASVSMMNTLVKLGDGSTAQSQLSSVPTNLILDRVYIHGSATMDLRRCVELNSASSAIINSHLSDAHSAGTDAQAILGYNGPGPYRIANNFLEGAGENIMFGGATPALAGNVPSDIEIVGNYLSKQTAWPAKWTVKNLFEVKFGQRILVEGNVFENNWVAGQTGFAVNLKTEVSSAQPAGVTQDVTFRYNIIRNSPGAFTIAARPKPFGLHVRRIAITHNLLTEIGTFKGTNNGRMFQLLDSLTDVTIAHNTAIPNWSNSMLAFDGRKGVNLNVMDNVLVRGMYGVRGSGVTEGVPSLDAYWKTWLMTNNVIVGLVGSLTYPANNYNVATLLDVGFVNAALGDYRMLPVSLYSTKATDGSNVGADMTTLSAKTAKTIAGK